jgi:hypothetical protein
LKPLDRQLRISCLRPTRSAKGTLIAVSLRTLHRLVMVPRQSYPQSAHPISVDSPEKVRERSNKAMAHVVIAMLQFGLTNCKLARTRKTDLDKYIKNASKCLDTADTLMWKLTLAHPDFDQMMALSEQLKFELESLRAIGAGLAPSPE